MADEVKKQLEDSRAKAIITSAEIAQNVLKAASGSLPSEVPRIVIEDGTYEIPDGTIPFKVRFWLLVQEGGIFASIRGSCTKFIVSRT